jgi:ribosome maturation protein SDO1
MVGVDKAIIARYKVGKENFEILVDADLAYDFKHGNNKIPIEDILAERKIYFDAKEGLLASEIKFEELFKTKDILEVAKKIILKGDVQITTEHMHKLREEKRKKIMQFIHANVCDPKTSLPHPMTRIESAMEQVKYNIDAFKPAELQAQEIINLLKPVIPIRIGSSDFEIKIPHQYVNASKPTVKKMANVKLEKFDSQGNWFITVSLPSGLVEEFFDALNSHTHGEILSKKI